MESASETNSKVKAGARWARALCACGIALFITGAVAQFWAIFGGHRLQTGVEYTWDGDWPVYLVGQSGIDDKDRPGRNNLVTSCTVTSSNGQSERYAVRVVRIDRLGLYGTKVGSFSDHPATVECKDSTLTTGPIVALYPHTGAMEVFGFLFAVVGRIVGWPRNRPHFGKWNLGPR
jgi:hypothetical protein